jgi:hypothetical protein
MYTLLILKNTCQVLTPPFDLIAYPFLDLNFAKGVHNFVNAILYWFVSMPLITVQRCAAVSAGDPPAYEALNWMRFLMCTPDVTPGFSYMIAGVRRFGQLVDNWSNAMWLILLGALGLPTPTCAPIPLEMRAVAEQTLFGGHETRIVGLTTGAYAVTDGSSVQYVFFLGQITKVWSQFAWAGAPSLKHGLAAVVYDIGDSGIDANSGQSTLSMLGCRCIDAMDDLGVKMSDGASTRMQIECSILRYDPGMSGGDNEDADIASPHFVPVTFAVPTAALYMRCATTKIVVDSARFPLWRLGEYREAGRASNYDNPYDGEFTHDDGIDGPDEVDAVIWVIPACDGNDNSLVCQEALMSSGCYPYCMAARKTGSRNDGLTLYSRDDWVENVQLMDHDCASKVKGDTSAGVVQFEDKNTVTASSQHKGVTYSNHDIIDGKYVFSKSWDPVVQDCVYDATRSSRISKGTLITASSDIERYAAILMNSGTLS